MGSRSSSASRVNEQQDTSLQFVPEVFHFTAVVFSNVQSEAYYSIIILSGLKSLGPLSVILLLSDPTGWK